MNARELHLFNNDFKQALLNQISRLVAGPVLLLVLPLYLSPEAQGYWFSIMGLAALTLFADLGFSTLILQFTAHEFAHLSFDARNRFVGNPEKVKKMASLFAFALKWGCVAGVTVFPLIALVGYAVLNKGGATLNWQGPWFLYCLTSVIVFLNSIALACLEGCNGVGAIQKIRYQSALISTATLIGGLIGGLELHALALASLLSGVYVIVKIRKQFGETFRQVWIESRGASYRWGAEIFPLLWKYAVSWVSGYFIFQVFTPLAFYEHGPVAAGKVGLSIAIWMAVFGVANTWMVIITPKMNMLMSERKHQELNAVFSKGLKLSLLTYAAGTMVFFVASLLFHQELRFLFDRIASQISLLILASIWFLQIPINAYALYMRAQKIEPLMYVSLFGGVYVVLATMFASHYFVFDYYFSGFLCGQVLGLPIVYKIYCVYRKV